MEFKNPPWHFGTRYANQKLQWLPCDTEECFQQSSQNSLRLNYFREQGWLEPDAITYKINSNGFRADEFRKGEPCVVGLGCSYTIGIGLPLKDLWPTLVGEALELTTYNLAWGGVGSDTCYRLAEYWLPILKPNLVVMLAPPRSRIELLTIDTNIQAEVFLPASESCIFSDKDIFLKTWFANEENAKINNRKNRLAVEKLCDNLDIKCLTYDAHDYMAQPREIVGYARDYMHPGPKAHQLFATQVINDYNGL
jgi:hypothetical protein